MGPGIQFETPENVQISYQLAGPGTRFIAWFTDTLLIGIVAVILFFTALIAGAAMDIASEDGLGHSAHALWILGGLFWLAYSLGNLFYFRVCELLLRGQTIGKRSVKIRVVKADGFSLDPLAIFLRTIFRVIDHLPPMFIVPLMTKKCRRLGDLVAGTIVVSDEKTDLGTLREQLSSQRTVGNKFQFDATMLMRARPQDVTAIEKVLERWSNLSDQDRQSLIARMLPPLAARMQIECPPPADGFEFFRDFLAAEYRRQHRKLG